MYYKYYSGLIKGRQNKRVPLTKYLLCTSQKVFGYVPYIQEMQKKHQNIRNEKSAKNFMNKVEH